MSESSTQAHDPRIEGYASALFEVARAEGTLDEVEDELFRFARSYESSEELRNTLSDELIPSAQAPVDHRGPPRRQSDVDDGAARRHGRRLRPRPRSAADHRPSRAASRRVQGRHASPRCAAAVALTSDQQDRSKAALANATGRNVSLKVVVDPSVLGGLVATVGDTVIDGSVRTNLDQLKSRL